MFDCFSAVAPNNSLMPTLVGLGRNRAVWCARHSSVVRSLALLALDDPRENVVSDQLVHVRPVDVKVAVEFDRAVISSNGKLSHAHVRHPVGSR